MKKWIVQWIIWKACTRTLGFYLAFRFRRRSFNSHVVFVIPIGNLTMHLLLGNQLVLRVHRDLHVVPHPHASATVHRPGVGVGQRELVLATLLQRLTVRFETRLALS